MKLQNPTVTVIFLILLVESDCGLIDSIYGGIKNTTSGLTQDAKNVWASGKSIIGLDSKNNEDLRPEEEKRGLIGGMVHSAREKVHSIRNYFWNTDVDSADAGLFGNVYNHVKSRMMRVKDLILEGGQGDGYSTPPPSEKVQIVRDTLNKLFFGNGTRQVHGKAFQEAVEKLRKAFHDIRNNITSTTTKPLHHGEGLIDVRAAVGNIRDSVNDNTASINNNFNDKVDDGINTTNNKAAEAYNTMKQTDNNGVNTVRNEVNEVAHQLRDKTSDITAKENELLGNTNKINVNVKNTNDKLKDALKEVKRFSY